jgi:hypothetical protein
MITRLRKNIAGKYKPYRYQISVLLCAIALSACDVHVKGGYFDEDKAQALAGVEKFRAFYARHDYAQLYDLGSAALKATMSRERFVSVAQASYAQYGEYESSVLVASSCFPNEVRLAYDAKYQKANVRELMIWSVPGHQAELQMYEIHTGQERFDKAKQVGCPIP